MYLNGGRYGKGRNLHDQGFKWKDGEVFCAVCPQIIKQPRCMVEHCDTQKHVKNFRASKVSEGKSLVH